MRPLKSKFWAKNRNVKFCLFQWSEKKKGWNLPTHAHAKKLNYFGFFHFSLQKKTVCAVFFEVFYEKVIKKWSKNGQKSDQKKGIKKWSKK